MGGVHAGAPKTDKEKALAEINNLYVGGNTRAATRQLQAISRIIIKALQSLREAVQNAA